MTNKDFLKLKKAIDEVRVKNIVGSVKFLYAINKNFKVLNNHFDSLIKEVPIVENYSEYMNKLVELDKKYKDKSSKEFDDERKELEKKYEKVIKAIDEAKKIENEIVSREVKIEIHKIPISDFPDNQLNSIQLENLELMIL